MITVNRFWLRDVWAPINNEGDDVDAINFVDMRRAQNIEVLADQYMKPYFNQLPKKVATLLKETWRYAILAYDEDQLESSIDAVLPPFSVPSQVRQFYINVWNATFPDEDWQISNPDEYRDLYDRDLWVFDFAK